MSEWLNFPGSENLVAIAIGLGVGCIVFLIAKRFMGLRRSREAALAFSEGDLPWEELLQLLKTCHGEKGGGLPGVSEEFSKGDLEALLTHVRKSREGSTATGLPPEPAWSEEDYQFQAGPDRRKSRRRWLNPIEVRLVCFSHEKLHGIVVNRSTGGLAILTQVELAAETPITVVSLEAPAGTQPAEVIVRHARRVGKLWLLGCQYREETSWKVKVWFG